jgi:hypothetical protein
MKNNYETIEIIAKIRKEIIIGLYGEVEVWSVFICDDHDADNEHYKDIDDHHGDYLASRFTLEQVKEIVLNTFSDLKVKFDIVI